MIQTIPQKEDKFAETILPDPYIRYSPVNAEITGHTDNRLLVFDRHWLKAADQVIRKRHPEKANAIWSQTGLNWGKHTYSMIEKLSQSVFPDLSNIQNLGMEQFQTLFTNHIAITGWGNFELKRRDQFLFVDLYDSLTVDCLKENASDSGNQSNTVCFLYAGFFAGIFSSLSKMELGCLEITCQISGYEFCSFLLDNQETIALVEKHIQGGMSPLDAFEKVKKEIAD